MKNRNKNIDYRLVIGIIAVLIGLVSAAAGIFKFGVPVGIPMLLIGIILILYIFFEKR